MTMMILDLLKNAVGLLFLSSDHSCVVWLIFSEPLEFFEMEAGSG